MSSLTFLNIILSSVLATRITDAQGIAVKKSFKRMTIPQSAWSTTEVYNNTSSNIACGGLAILHDFEYYVYDEQMNVCQLGTIGNGSEGSAVTVIMGFRKPKPGSILGIMK